MNDQFTTSIVSILTKNGAIVGAGFLVSDNYVLTCAHVVAAALGLPQDTPKKPTTNVLLNFPLIGRDKISYQKVNTGRVIIWRPVSSQAEHGSDLALLELEAGPPTGSQPGRMVVADDLWGHSFRAFGFPGGYDNGVWASGVIRAVQANGWVQIEDVRETGYFVKPGFSGTPVWDDQTDGIIGMVVAVELISDIRAAFIIPTTILMEICPEIGRLAIPPCPYRGLRAFQEENAPFFFGRETLTEKLVEAVNNKPLVAVIGPSGSGKSSVVFAGIIPSLRSEENWLITSFRPGQNPFHALAAAIVPLLAPQMSPTERLVEMKKLTEKLKQGKLTLQDIRQEIILQNSDRVLLVADQFEELFTLCREAEVRRRFIDGLLGAVRMEFHQRKPYFCLIITLRADFLGHVLSHRPLADALQHADLKLGPMNDRELQDAIELPAHKLKIKIEDGLTERLLEAVSRAPGTLPLLEFALTLLWAKQKSGKLTHAAYDEIGGVEKALAGYAEEKYGKFTEEEQKTIHRIFIQLVHPGEGTEDTRRLATRTEIGEDNWQLVTDLADARLVVSGHNETTEEETVEIAHEALIGGWDRLRQWIKANRTFRTWQERLRAAMHQWEASGLDEGALLRGALLVEAENWLQDRHEDLSRTEQTFIGASLREQTARARLYILIIYTITSSLLIALILAGIAGLLWRRAERQRQSALGRQLAAQSELVRKQRANLLPRSVLLAVEAMCRFPSLEAYQALRNGLALLPLPVLRILHNHNVTAVAFSPDGQYLATASKDQTAQVWEVAGCRKVTAVKHKWHITALAFSPNGEYLATASDDHTAKVWKTATGQKVAYMNHNDNVTSVTFSPDGKYLATASDDHTARIWDATGGQEINHLAHKARVTAVIFSPDGQYLATASDDHTARIWEMISGQEAGCIIHEDKVTAVDFSPDGDYLATASSDHTAQIWNISRAQRTTSMGKAEQVIEKIVSLDHDGEVVAVTFNTDGNYLATCGGDHIHIWDTATGLEVRRMIHEDKVTAVTFGPNGYYLATASEDGTARVWKADNGREIIRLAHKDKVMAVTFSPDGRYLATASSDNTAGIWEATSIYKDGCLAHNEDVTAVAFSPDGKYLATASLDLTARIFETKSGQEVRRLNHYDSVIALAFSPDGKYLATASQGHPAQVWEVSSGQKISRMIYKYALAFSPDGKYLATASSANNAQVWEVSNGRKIATMPHGGIVTIVAFSPDGKYLATAGKGHSIRVWEMKSSREVACLKHTDEVTAITYSPNGQYLATASRDRTARVWESTGNREITCLKHADEVVAVTFSPDGQYLATAGQDHKARVWKPTSGREITCLKHEAGVSVVLFSPDGKYLITSDKDHTARIWKVDGSQEIAHIKHKGDIYAVALSPDGKYLTTAGKDHTVRICKVDSGQEIACLKHPGAVSAVSFIPDGKTLATACKDCIARVWEITSGREFARLSHADEVAAITFSPEGRYLATTSRDHTSQIWETTKYLKIARIKHECHLYTIAFSPNGSCIATANADHTARIWEATSGQELAHIRHKGHVRDVDFSPDGKYLATASGDHTARIWKITGNQEVACLKHEMGVSAVEFSPDGKYLATASGDHTARIWRASGGQEVACMNHEMGVSAISFSPEGKFLATAGRDKTARIWKMPSGREVARMDHEGFIYAISFSPDGRYLTTAGGDHTAHIWEVTQGNEVACMPHEGIVFAAVFSPNGKYLATAGSDRTARIWLWRPKDMIAEACIRLNPNFYSKGVGTISRGRAIP